MARVNDEPLSLVEAAAALGVHYQTAYRWVRAGRLPAQVVNGQYVVARRDIDGVLAGMRQPTAPRRPGTVRLDRQAERMYEGLVAGDEPAARQIAVRLVEEGTLVRDLISTVLVPPLRRIGQKWHDGELTIWVEHRASAIVERILGELAPHPRGRRRGTVLVASVAGDMHSLPTVMAAVCLREANWVVHHFGANMPPEDLLGFCAEHHVDVAVLSVTNPDVAELATATAERLRSAGTPTVVGGPGRSLAHLLDEVRLAAT